VVADPSEFCDIGTGLELPLEADCEAVDLTMKFSFAS
jgi:hypothetical protein